MLILILFWCFDFDVQYSQNAVFSFEKFPNRQNHASSGSHYLSMGRRPPPPIPPSEKPWKICVKKFIFSKFAGFQAYSRQRYYQVNSFTDIFRQHFKPSPHAPPMYWLKPHHQILKNHLQWGGGGGRGTDSPMFATPVGNSAKSGKLIKF